MATPKAITPSNLTIAGQPESPGMSTHRKNSVVVAADIRPQGNSSVRLVVWVSTTSNFTSQRRVVSGWGGARRASVTIDNLVENRRYWIRVHTDQRNMSANSGANAANFWTERAPLAPELLTPADNITLNEGDDLSIHWNHRDADTPADDQLRAQVQWRTAPGLGDPGSAWTTATVEGTDEDYTITGASLKVNAFSEWRVRTRDVHSSFWSPWSLPRSFFVLGTNTPPRLDSPVKSEAVPVDVPVTFEWTFRDPSGDLQSRADIRFRASGTETWTIINGDPDPLTPGGAQEWTLPEGTFQPGFIYEWQVRTYDDSGSGDPSEWSVSAFFRSILTPGLDGAGQEWLGPVAVQGSLGTGEYRVFVYDQGGQRVRGEITSITSLRWTRLRDDISAARIVTSGFGDDCCEILREIVSWAHEIVIFRNGERVWEGPVTLKAFHLDEVEIEARDVMAYVYRRIMRQGYNDNVRILRRDASGQVIKKSQPRSVVERSAFIITNALAPHDPNVLPWLTRFDFEDDARQARAVADWSKSAWEEVDSLAATAGLDYTTVGRRIILWDTHRPIGLLAEMRAEDFFTPPVATQYGMSAANIFGVTNNAGLFGVYSFPEEQWGGVGPIEQLASEYAEGSTGGAPETMTPSQISEKRANLNSQAKRNAGGRWPPPLIVRVPDNSRLRPSTAVGINQLVPGVHIPLRMTTRCIDIAQIQKLDSVTVLVDSDGDEKVQVVMSPAPGAEQDADASAGGEE